MKKFYIAYYENLQRTECIIVAQTKGEARKKFRQEHGENVSIIQFKEMEMKK